MFWKFLWDCQVEEVVETFQVLTISGGKTVWTEAWTSRQHLKRFSQIKNSSQDNTGWMPTRSQARGKKLRTAACP